MQLVKTLPHLVPFLCKTKYFAFTTASEDVVDASTPSSTVIDKLNYKLFIYSNIQIPLLHQYSTPFYNSRLSYGIDQERGYLLQKLCEW